MYLQITRDEVVGDVLNCSFHSPISLSRTRHVDDAPADRWPFVAVKLKKPSTPFTCRVSNAICFSLNICVVKKPFTLSYMVSHTRDNPPPETTLANVYIWKRFPCRLSQRWPCMIIHNPYWIIKCADILLSLRFPRSFDRSGFYKVNFHFFDTNFCFNLLLWACISWHQLRRGVYMKKSSLACLVMSLCSCCYVHTANITT